MPDRRGHRGPRRQSDFILMARRIAIVGASSTLGLATAKVLHEQGDELWLTYHSEGKVRTLAESFGKAQVSRLDLLELAQIKDFANELSKKWPALDGLVVASGVGLLHPASRNSDPAVAALFQVNVLSPIALARALYKPLLGGSSPAVVFFSSTMGLVGAGGMSAYAASKSAVANLARTLAIEWAPKKIRVNAIAPGVVPSPLVEKMFSVLPPEQVDLIRSRHPLGFGEPADVAHAVSFLLSPQARWITGIVLPVDGGYTAQ